MRRIITLVVAAFLTVGVVGWMAGMPRPAESVPFAFAEVAPPALVGQGRSVAAGEVSGIAQPEGSASAQEVAPSATDGIVSTEWLTRVSGATGIPVRSLQAYTTAALTLEVRAPDCALGWNTLAAIGEVESQHGTHGGTHIDAGGTLVGSILGPRLDGTEYAAVADTDGGHWDGDAEYDRAVGPMQFVPETWAVYGEDASGDGIADPNQIDDAALSAGIYLCTTGQNLSTDAGWTSAIRAYNNNDEYVETVRTQSNDYSQLAG